MTKWAALAVALGALAVVGCEMPQSAPLEMLVEAPRTLRAAGHTTLEVSQVNASTRDRVRITHWPDNVTDAYFSSGTVDGTVLRPNGISRTITIKCIAKGDGGVGIRQEGGRTFMPASSWSTLSARQRQKPRPLRCAKPWVAQPSATIAVFFSGGRAVSEHRR